MKSKDILIILLSSLIFIILLRLLFNNYNQNNKLDKHHNKHHHNSSQNYETYAPVTSNDDMYAPAYHSGEFISGNDQYAPVQNSSNPPNEPGQSNPVNVVNSSSVLDNNYDNINYGEFKSEQSTEPAPVLENFELISNYNTAENNPLNLYIEEFDYDKKLTDNNEYIDNEILFMPF